MSQTYTTSTTASGAKAVEPRVTVENCGHFALSWKCMEYVKGKDLDIVLVPGEKDKFDFDYARRTFGDWKVDPTESPEKRIEWNGMIAYTKRRSPSCDGKLPQVKIYNDEGDLLWDAQAQMALWLEHNKMSPTAFDAPGGSPLGNVPMPKILADAEHPALKVLYLKAYGSKLPAGMSSETARKAIMPYLRPDQLKAELEEHYAGKAPDMSQYRK